MGKKIKDLTSSGGEEDRKVKRKRKLEEEEAQINGEVIETPEISASKKSEKKKKKKEKKNGKEEENTQLENGSELSEGFNGESGKKKKKEEKRDGEVGEEEKKSYGGVVVSGKNSGDSKYAPLSSFADSKLPDNVLECCKGFAKPSPIQAHAWPFLLKNRDLIGIAQTGSGKTLAFGIPAIMHVLGKRKDEKSRRVNPLCLFLSPTRELAQQIADVLCDAGKSCGIKTACFYGGTSKGPQLSALKSGIDIAIGTPGCLKDLIEMGACRLQDVSFVVLDEADRMLDMGFEQDVRSILSKTNSADWWDSYGDECPELKNFAIRILSLTCSSSGCERNWSAFEMVHTKKRNRLHQQKMNDLVFVMYNLKLKRRHEKRASKSITEPIVLEELSSDDEWIAEEEEPVLPTNDAWFTNLDRAARRIAREVTRNGDENHEDHDARQMVMFSATWPMEVHQLAQEFMDPNPIKVVVGSEDLAANHDVMQIVEVLEENTRDRRLVSLLDKYHESQKNRVIVFVLYQKEGDRVERMLQGRGWNVVAIHAGKPQSTRTKSLALFKSGTCPLLIATDVAARGLDIPDVEVVINYSFPLTTEDYVHRIGRTGRAGKKGVAHTFFTKENKGLAGELVNVLREANQHIPPDLVKFGTHVKKKESKLYGAHFREITADAPKATKITFADSDDE